MCAIAHRPYAIEFQSIAHTVFLDKHGCCSRAGDEIDALGVEGRNGRIEAAGVVHVEKARAIGAYQTAAYTIDGFNNMLLNGSTLSVLFRESSANNDEAFAAFLFGQHINGLGAELGSNAKDGTFHLRQLIDVGVAFHALHLGLFRVHSINGAAEGTLQKVFQSFSTGFVDV